MFEPWKIYSKILVTGPQRSGTTIATKMIAEDTGHKFMSQAWLEGGNPIEKLREICEKEKDFVIQCPGESFMIEKFSADDVLIVFMIRNISDIVSSEKAHKWDGHAQKVLYGVASDKRPISVIKYERWEKQKLQIEHWAELQYEHLENHPLFVPKKDRVNWHIRQIDISNQYQKEVMYPEKNL